MNRGEIWCANLGEPALSGLGFRRPVLIIQNDDFTRSAIRTVVVAAITSNVAVASADGNILITSRQSGLPKDSVINVSQILTIDKSFLFEHVSILSDARMEQVDQGLKTVLGLT